MGIEYVMTEKTDVREELQKEYLRLSFLRERLNSLLTQQKMIETKIKEIESSIKTLNEVVSLKNGDEILSNVGSNVFVFSKIADSENVLVNIGANVVVKKKIDDAIKHLEEKIKQLKITSDAITKEVSQLTPVIAESEEKLSRLAKESEMG
jgi:prefoldin alpha subunit